MKRTVLYAILLASIVVAFSSCKKCYTCDFGNGRIEKFCPKDFPDGYTGEKLTIDAYQAQGYVCTAD